MMTVLSLSGGKDSTAAALWLREHAFAARSFAPEVYDDVE